MASGIATLTAAFSFGFLFQAAVAVSFLYINGNRSKVFQDGPRLVLVLFLLFAALWAQLDFANLLLPTTATGVCQGTLVASTFSDQLARIAMEQFLLWSIGHGTKLSVGRLILQGILIIRLIMGGVFVGFTRPEFAPSCVPQTPLIPISIIVLSLDVLVIVILLIRLGSLGMFNGLGENSTNKALILTVAAFAVWTGSSVAKTIALPGTHILLRTILPSVGLYSIIAVLAIFPSALFLSKSEEMTTPEAHSPFVAPPVTSREVWRGLNSNGSPKSGNIYSKSRALFVVNQTPRESPTYTQANRQSDTRGFQRLDDGATDQDRVNEQRQDHVKRGPGYRGSSGVFGALITAPVIGGISQVSTGLQTRPPPRSGTEESFASPANVQQKRILFNWISPRPSRRPPIRALGISLPVMAAVDGSNIQPFSKIPTVDLATAAQNDRERRKMAAARASFTPVRPISPKQLSTAQDGLRQNDAVAKEVTAPSRYNNFPTASPHPAPVLPFGTQARSTSAFLSPGIDEMRRRSPQNIDSVPRQLDRRSNIQTGLQRKPTMGLPSNPKAQKAPNLENRRNAQERVMLFREVVYEDPEMVNRIIRDATNSHEALEGKPSNFGNLLTNTHTRMESSESIIHRPRPYRKNSDIDRALFPSDAPPHHSYSKSGSIAIIPDAAKLDHKRSKSSSAVSSHRSLLNTPFGSPTELPPLPPMPKTAAELCRLLPNDTKSMTVDEKIELLFPAPPQSTLIQRRRSSVPSLPRLPSIYLAESQAAKSPTEGTIQSRRASKRTTIGSSVDVMRQRSPHHEAHHIINFSPNEFEYPDNIGASCTVQAIKSSVMTQEVEEHSGRRNFHLVPTKASPVNEAFQDDATTDWGSIHSKPARVDLRNARLNARSTIIQKRNIADRIDTFAVQSSLLSRYSDQGNSIPMVLDFNADTHSGSSPSYDVRPSLLLGGNEAVSHETAPLPRGGSVWHRRLGDQLLTFSDRVKTKSRKMPPPTPLILNRIGKHTAILVHAPEPSPVEPPQQAIDDIKAQLARFDKPSQDDFGSILRHVDNTKIQIEDRLRLLETLEKEMGQQENQWQQMQHNLDRDSISTTMSTVYSPAVQSSQQPNLTRNSSKRESRRLSRASLYHSRVRSGLTQSSKAEDLNSTMSSQSSDNSRASVWQQRLADAQMEYLENAPSLLGQSFNFLALSKAQLGSPTPPDSEQSETDNDTGFESSSEDEYAEQQISVARVSQPLSKLWQPETRINGDFSGHLWSYSGKEVEKRVSIAEPAAEQVRLARRVSLQPLIISSSNLWAKPSPGRARRFAFGLWRPQSNRPSSIVVKRASHKPERKSRRMTYLPDIIESPLPIPNKRDTTQLGIFRFPWGETSDQPVYQPPSYMNFLGSSTISSTPSPMKSQVPQPEFSEYTSSFFDDYDEEESGDDEANYDSSDDEFDESTLSDIAEMLKSTEVPSRRSMFSPREIIEDYDGDTDFDSDEDDEEQVVLATMPPMRLPIQPLAIPLKSPYRVETSKPVLPIGKEITSELSPGPRIFAEFVHGPVEQSLLWTPMLPKKQPPEAGLSSKSVALRSVRGADPIPAAATKIMARKSSFALPLPKLSSQQLWSLKQVPASVTNWLGASLDLNSVSNINITQLLWTPPTKAAKEPLATGLFSTLNLHLTRRTSNMEPAALLMSRKMSYVKADLSLLDSDQLWSPSSFQPTQPHWITVSSVRPASPSLCSSEYSSGRTTPSSELDANDMSDTESVTTMSTTASSVWNSLRSASKSAWWESRFTKSPQDSPKKTTSTIPSAAQQNSPALKEPNLIRSKKATEALPTVRESRVLTSRDMWEALTQAPSNASAKNVTALADLKIKASPTAGTSIHDKESQTKPARLWCSPVTIVPALSHQKSFLWSIDDISHFSVKSHHITETAVVRRTLQTENPDFMVLKSSALWSPVNATTVQREWLARHPIRSKIWNPKEAPKNQETKQYAAMWTSLSTNVSMVEPEDMFACNYTRSLRKPKVHRSTALQRLDSTFLFTPPSTDTLVTANWLLSTSAVFVSSPIQEIIPCPILPKI